MRGGSRRSTWLGAVMLLATSILAVVGRADDLAEASPGTCLVIIVHPSRAEPISERVLRRIFLKQRRFWADGEVLNPVNRPAGSPEREAFSESLFGRPSRAHLSYWNRAYYDGIMPPITLESDRAVVLFVAKRPNAIGYVRPSATDDSVAIVNRIPAPQSAECVDSVR